MFVFFIKTMLYFLSDIFRPVIHACYAPKKKSIKLLVLLREKKKKKKEEKSTYVVALVLLSLKKQPNYCRNHCDHIGCKPQPTMRGARKSRVTQTQSPGSTNHILTRITHVQLRGRIVSNWTINTGEYTFFRFNCQKGNFW